MMNSIRVCLISTVSFCHDAGHMDVSHVHVSKV